MNKNALAICGVILFLGGIGLSIYFWVITSDARNLDRFDAPISKGKCSTPLKKASTSRDIISKTDSLALTAILSNPDRNKNCEVEVSLYAPKFNITPNKQDQIINLPPREEATLSWILTPRYTGTFEIVVSAGLSSKTVGITVTDKLIVPSWFPLVASFLGPMLTLPWWYEQWQKRKQQAQSKNI